MRPGRLSLATVILSAGALCLDDQKPLAQAANSVSSAGNVIVEPATLISAGFEWPIEGDRNRNATVAVTYRKKGDSEWRKGLPLLRIGGERTVFQGALDYTAPNMFAGSLFGLTENTEYEVQFALSDPDGVGGSDKNGLTRSLTLRTRAEPQPSTAGRIFHVYPPGHEGAKQEPAFLGCWRRTTWRRLVATGAVPLLHVCGLETRSWFTLASTGTSIARAPDFTKPTQLYDPDTVDLRLREGSAAVDAAVDLPGITDGFLGRAPDLGAYELGAPPIHYGPRERGHP